MEYREWVRGVKTRFSENTVWDMGSFFTRTEVITNEKIPCRSLPHMYGVRDMPWGEIIDDT